MGQTRAILLKILPANTVGALIVFVYFTFVVPIPTEDRLSQATVDLHHRIAALLFVGLLVAFLPVYLAQFHKAARPILDWLASGRPPDDTVRRAVLGLPFRQAVWSFADWFVAAVLFAGFNLLWLADGAATTIRVAGGIVIGGVATSGFVYLLVERELRPLFAQVLDGDSPPRPVVRTRTRLLAAWVLGSGLAMVGIVVGPLGLPASEGSRELRATVFLAVVGLAAGAFFLMVAARSVTDPLDEVRLALARVEAGDLDVSVDVDDSGEVGLLQAGFNHMVEGLRQREELADLFGRHVGAEVAGQAVSRGARLGGEQLVVSTLFVDLLGSTALAQALPAAEVVQILNRMFGAVVEAVTAEGGWVNKFEGDGAMCVFGAPVALDDHAARALRAARALHLALVSASVDAAIAVSSGPAVAGNVGSERRFEYTVIGDPVNEASRLSEEAKLRPDRVLASSASVVLAGGAAGPWALDSVVVLRGRDTPTEAYRPA
jgi:adenylate cyclase